jgi:hypothetical protein
VKYLTPNSKVFQSPKAAPGPAWLGSHWHGSLRERESLRKREREGERERALLGTIYNWGSIRRAASDDDVFYLFLQKQKSGQSYIPQGYFHPPYEAV